MCSKTVNKLWKIMKLSITRKYLWNCLSSSSGYWNFFWHMAFYSPLVAGPSSGLPYTLVKGLHKQSLQWCWINIFLKISYMWKAIWPTFDILTYKGWRSEPRGANEVFGPVLTKVTMLTQTHFHCHSHLSAVWRTGFKWFLSELRHFALSPEIGWPVTNDGGQL